jgi:hypothetical protein
MVFFDSKANMSGSESLIVGRQWWLFPAIIPLTILVFTTWVAWQRYRSRVDAESLGISEGAQSLDIVEGAQSLGIGGVRKAWILVLARAW